MILIQFFLGDGLLKYLQLNNDFKKRSHLANSGTTPDISARIMI